MDDGGLASGKPTGCELEKLDTGHRIHRSSGLPIENGDFPQFYWCTDHLEDQDYGDIRVWIPVIKHGSEKTSPSDDFPIEMPIQWISYMPCL